VLDVVAYRLTAMYLLSTTKQAILFKSSTKQQVLLYTSLGGVNERFKVGRTSSLIRGNHISELPERRDKQINFPVPSTSQLGHDMVLKR